MKDHFVGSRISKSTITLSKTFDEVINPPYISQKSANCQIEKINQLITLSMITWSGFHCLRNILYFNIGNIYWCFIFYLWLMKRLRKYFWIFMSWKNIFFLFCEIIVANTIRNDWMTQRFFWCRKFPRSISTKQINLNEKALTLWST